MPGPPSAKSKQQVVYHTCTKQHGAFEVDELTPDYYTNVETQESMCGLDERKKVIATTMLPYAAICKLEMRAANGKHVIGTGWLSHDNRLYTAGHCVFSHRHGGWMDSIVVIPGMSGKNAPYGRYTADRLLAARGWTVNKDPRYDMGAIKLDGAVAQALVLEPSLTDVSEGTVCGYPGDRDRGVFQYKMRDALRKDQGRFFYMLDTYGGQSGSPVLRDNRRAIGIHNYGGCENSGSDLYKGFVDAVKNW